MSKIGGTSAPSAPSTPVAPKAAETKKQSEAKDIKTTEQPKETQKKEEVNAPKDETELSQDGKENQNNPSDILEQAITEALSEYMSSKKQEMEHYKMPEGSVNNKAGERDPKNELKIDENMFK